MSYLNNEHNIQYIINMAKKLILNSKYDLYDYKFISKVEIFSIINFIYIYYSNLSKHNFILNLSKKGKLLSFQINNNLEYERIIRDFWIMDNNFFILFFGKGYNELLESWELLEISSNISNFFNKNVDGKIFEEYINYMWKNYRIWFYALFNKVLDGKIYYNRSNNIKDYLLEKNMDKYYKQISNI